jgi:hypothetical protein
MQPFQRQLIRGGESGLIRLQRDRAPHAGRRSFPDVILHRERRGARWVGRFRTSLPPPSRACFAAAKSALVTRRSCRYTLAPKGSFFSTRARCGTPGLYVAAYPHRYPHRGGATFRASASSAVEQATSLSPGRRDAPLQIRRENNCSRKTLAAMPRTPASAASDPPPARAAGSASPVSEGGDFRSRRRISRFYISRDAAIGARQRGSQLNVMSLNRKVAAKAVTAASVNVRVAFAPRPAKDRCATRIPDPGIARSMRD